MKEIVLSKKDDKVTYEIKDVKIPKPEDNEVLIKVNVSGTNPKDWKYINPSGFSNTGDDIAGVVSGVGSKVSEFKEGDRVAAFHVMQAPHGSFAEYAIAPAQTTFHIPKNISDEEAATIPLCILTAGVGVHGQLGLPTPWHPATTELPFLVYGGSSSNGLFALKLARLSGLSPIIAVAGAGADVINEGNYADIIVDYRKGDVTEGIIKALKGAELKYAYDAICEQGSTVAVSKAMTSGGTITGILPVESKTLANGVKFTRTYVGSVHHDYNGSVTKETLERDREYAYVLTKYVTRLLENGKLKGHPYEVVKGGLDGVADALNALMQKKVSGKKLLVKISGTESI